MLSYEFKNTSNPLKIIKKNFDMMPRTISLETYLIFDTAGEP